MLSIIYLLLALVAPAIALRVEDLADGRLVDISENYTVKWAPEATDPPSVVIDLTNSTVNTGNALIRIATNITTSLSEYEIDWPDMVSSDNKSYILLFSTPDTGSVIGQSGIFNLYLPANETRNPESSTDTSTETGSEEPEDGNAGQETSDIVAETVAPTVIVVLIMCFGATRFFRKRNSAKQAAQAARDLEAAKLALGHDPNGDGSDLEYPGAVMSNWRGFENSTTKLHDQSHDRSFGSNSTLNAPQSDMSDFRFSFVGGSDDDLHVVAIHPGPERQTSLRSPVHAAARVGSSRVERDISPPRGLVRIVPR